MWNFWVPRFVEPCAQISSEGFWPIAENFFYDGFRKVSGKVTIPLLVREVLKIEEGDYVRINISQVIKKKKQRDGKKGGKK